MPLAPGERIRRGRRLLLVGMVGVVGGMVLEAPVPAWSGLAIIFVGFASNTVGKATHFRALPIPATERWSLLGTWVALALLAAAIVTVLVASAFAGVESAPFWQLAVAAAAVGVVHRRLQVRFLSDVDEVGPGEY